MLGSVVKEESEAPLRKGFQRPGEVVLLGGVPREAGEDNNPEGAEGGGFEMMILCTMCHCLLIYDTQDYYLCSIGIMVNH